MAAEYLIRPDGTGDFPTIQAAIDASAGGDIIYLADGTFVGGGNRDLDFHGKVITVQSVQNDPEACVLDCQGVPADPHRAVLFHSGEGPTSTFEGIQVTHGDQSGISGACGAVPVVEATWGRLKGLYL